MTPMLFPSGAAPAAPDGIVSSAPPGASQPVTAGVPEAAAGAVAPSDDSAAFLAELLEVLEDLSLPNAAVGATAGQEGSTTTARQSPSADALISQTETLEESGLSEVASGPVRQAAAPWADEPTVVPEDEERVSEEAGAVLAVAPPSIPLVELVAPDDRPPVVHAASGPATARGESVDTTLVDAAPLVTGADAALTTAQGTEKAASSGPERSPAHSVAESAGHDWLHTGERGPVRGRETESGAASPAAIRPSIDPAQVAARPEGAAPAPAKVDGHGGESDARGSARATLAEHLAALTGRESPVSSEGARSAGDGGRLRHGSNGHAEHTSVARSATPVSAAPPAPPQLPMAPLPAGQMTPGDPVEPQEGTDGTLEQATVGRVGEAGVDHPRAWEESGSPSLPTATDVRGQTRDGMNGRREDRGHRATEEWARRALSIEARLAPPAGFTLTTADVALARASMPERAAEAFGVRTPFEMPQPAENLSRLVQSIRVQSRDGVSQASVRLNPEHLGEVTVTVRVEGSSVTAIVRAESADVRQWLRGQEESIRASLAGQGLDLDDLVVDRDPSGQREPQEQPQAPPWQVSQRRRHGPEPRFEVSA